MSGMIHAKQHVERLLGCRQPVRFLAEPAPGLTAHGTSNQVEHLFLVPGRGPSKGVVQRLALLNMPQNLRDQQRLLNTGNHP